MSESEKDYTVAQFPEDSGVTFPLKISEVRYPHNDKAYNENLLFGGNCGDLVKIRPCAKEYEDKTYLGILIGGLAQNAGIMVSKQDDSGERALTVRHGMHNQMIFVPDLKKVIFGYESWWGKIKSVDEIKEITDKDIDNVWYVQMLKVMTKDQENDTGSDQSASC